MLLDIALPDSISSIWINAPLFKELISSNSIYMAPQGSWENLVRPLISSKKQYYTAVTLRLNTAVWKAEGKLGAASYCYILSLLCDLMSGTILHQPGRIQPVAWELTPDCQLHTHCTIRTKKKPFRKDILKKLRSSLNYFNNLGIQIKNFHIYLEELQTFDDLNNWMNYCNKTDDKRYLYYDIMDYYYKKAVPDRSALADADIEIDSNDHFKNKELHCNFIWKEYNI